MASRGFVRVMVNAVPGSQSMGGDSFTGEQPGAWALAPASGNGRGTVPLDLSS